MPLLEVAHLVKRFERRNSWFRAPTQITFGRYDIVTSTRFAKPMTDAIRGSELLIFEEASHAPIFESVHEFNRKTLAFLLRHTG